MRENAHQNNSEYGHLLFSAIFSKSIIIVIEKTQYILIKSSRSQMLKISQYSKENTCWSLSLKKVGSLYAFFLSIVKFLRTAFLVEHLRWLLLAFKHYITRSLKTRASLLEPSRTSTMKPFCENSLRLKTENYFRKKALSWMFDCILNTPHQYIMNYPS